jgi:hypothetical protein
MLYKHYVTLRGDLSTVKHLNNKDGFPTEGPYEVSEGDDDEGHYSTFTWTSKEPVSEDEEQAMRQKALDWDFNQEDGE